MIGFKKPTGSNSVQPTPAVGLEPKRMTVAEHMATMNRAGRRAEWARLKKNFKRKGINLV